MERKYSGEKIVWGGNVFDKKIAGEIIGTAKILGTGKY